MGFMALSVRSLGRIRGLDGLELELVTIEGVSHFKNPWLAVIQDVCVPVDRKPCLEDFMFGLPKLRELALL